MSAVKAGWLPVEQETSMAHEAERAPALWAIRSKLEQEAYSEGFTDALSAFMAASFGGTVEKWGSRERRRRKSR